MDLKSGYYAEFPSFLAGSKTDSDCPGTDPTPPSLRSSENHERLSSTDCPLSPVLPLTLVVKLEGKLLFSLLPFPSARRLLCRWLRAWGRRRAMSFPDRWDGVGGFPCPLPLSPVTGWRFFLSPGCYSETFTYTSVWPLAHTPYSFSFKIGDCPSLLLVLSSLSWLLANTTKFLLCARY